MKLINHKTITLAFCLIMISITASAAETLTNRSVERMVAAGLSPDIITSKIRSTQSTFDVSIDTILELKKKGIHDDIIKAMVEVAGSKRTTPPPRGDYNQSGQYYEPDSYRPQREMDQVGKLLADIKKATELKEKRDYTWKTKAHTIGATLKSIYPANTHNIKYWWAYSQYSLLVEKEHHVLKGIKKVLYFNPYHEDALILKGDIYLAQAKKMQPSDDNDAYSQDDMAGDAKQAYETALELPKISSTKKSKIYYKLGEMAQKIDQSKKRAVQYWQKAVDEEPRGEWGILAANKLGVAPPQNGQE